MAQSSAGVCNDRIVSLLVACAVIIGSGLSAGCQTLSDSALALSQGTKTSPQRTPAYEVATIKPPQQDEYAPSLRVYIQGAFGIPVNSKGWVFGPDWIDNTKYVIKGKPPDSEREAMQTMTQAQRSDEIRAMQRTLLLDRFNLKAHFETRDMPVYKLVLAKSGSQLKENPDAAKGRLSLSTSVLRGTAIPIRNLLSALENVPEIGGRVVIDETELPKTYDVLLRWTPMEAPTPPGELNHAPQASGEDFPSLFTAIEEQLGLKLVLTKAPGQVLIIDHIERPTEN